MLQCEVILQHVPNRQAGQGAESRGGDGLLKSKQQLYSTKLCEQRGLRKGSGESEAEPEYGIEGIWLNRNCYEANSSSEQCLGLG